MEGRPGFFLYRHGVNEGLHSAHRSDSACAVIELLPAQNHRRERWKNGGGWTREIARSPGEGEWHWRLSIAEIGVDGPFSRFDGCDRELVLLAGQGMDLHFDNGESVRLDAPRARVRFSGEREVSAHLLHGPTTDFNLMWRREVIDAQLMHRPLVGSMLFFGEIGVTWAIYVLAGEVRTAAGPLEMGDAALLRADTGRTVMNGGGELLIAKLVERKA